MSPSRRTLVLSLTVVLGLAALLSVSAVVFFLVRSDKEEKGPPTVESLLADIRGSDAEKRGAALEALDELGREHAAFIPLLVETLGDVDASIRRRIVEILPALGAMSREPLEDAVYDPDAAVSLAAVAGLLRLGADSLHVWIDAAHDDRESVRSAALEALASLGPEAAPAAPALLALLAQTRFENPVGRGRYVRGRTQRMPRRVPRSVVRRRGQDLVTRTIETLGALGPAVIPDIERSLDSGLLEPETEGRILGLLVELDPGREPTATRLVRRAEEVGAALRTGRPEEALAERLRELVDTAVQALSGMPAELAVPRLRRLLLHDDAGIALAAVSVLPPRVEALAEADAPLELWVTLVPALGKVLQGDDDDARIPAVETLGYLGREPEAADQATESLFEALRETGFGAAVREVWEERLDVDPDSRGVPRRPTPRARATSRVRLDDSCVQAVSRLGGGAAGVLGKRLGSDRLDDRCQALALLDRLEGDAAPAREALLKALEDESLIVRARAVRCLGRLASDEGRTARALLEVFFREAARTPGPERFNTGGRLASFERLVRMSLRAQGPSALSALMEGMTHSSPHVRYLALSALPSLQPPAEARRSSEGAETVVSAVVRVLQDPRNRLRLSEEEQQWLLDGLPEPSEDLPEDPPERTIRRYESRILKRAIHTLGSLGSQAKGAVPTLLGLRGDAELAGAVETTLLEMGQRDPAAAEAVFRWQMDKAWETLTEEGVDRREAARQSGLRRLLELDAAAVPHLMAGATSSESTEEVRVWSLELLLEFATDGRYRAFGASSGGGSTRRGSARTPRARQTSVTRQPPPSLVVPALPDILAACREGSQEERLLGLQLLSATWSPLEEAPPETMASLPEWLREQLDEGNRDLRNEALRLLGRLGERAKDILPDVLPILAAEIKRQLGEWGRLRLAGDNGEILVQFPNGVVVKPSADPWVEPVESCSRALVPHAPEALAAALRATDDRSIRLVFLSLVTPELPLETFEGVFLELLREGSSDERRRVLQLLSAHGAAAAAAVPALRARVQAESRRFREASSTLEREESFTSLEECLRVLEAMGNAARPAIEKLLGDPTPLVRREAIRLLLALDSAPRAIREKLQPLLEDDDVGVRTYAEWALLRTEGKARQEAEPAPPQGDSR